jgi:riboflavin biosynthesis pyrimidine reductase
LTIYDAAVFHLTLLDRGIAMSGRSQGLAIEPLWEAPEPPTTPVDRRGGPLPEALAARYPGSLVVDLVDNRPTIVANFVETLDGIVAIEAEQTGAGGRDISGYSEADLSMMALLRVLADVIVVGAGTLRNGSRHIWTAANLIPALAEDFAAWRSEMWLTPHPTLVVVTASGNVDATHAALNAPGVPVVIATTPHGAERLAELPFGPTVRVAVIGDQSMVPAGAILALVEELGGRLALCEGGPHLFGELLRARLVDELFLTMAPQVAGRDAKTHRLSLVEGASYGDGRGRWANLASIRRAGDDLFLRYRFEP